ncbi:hypothetical protein B566_EDAN019175 [Ephemera danica]|nr:hypothetical protein B566_EDAN019175 [Ephemera danica]
MPFGIGVGDVAQLAHGVHIHLPLGAGAHAPHLIARMRHMVQHAGAGAVVVAPVAVVLQQAGVQVINFLRDEYREHGHTPNFRNLLKAVGEDVLPGCDSKGLYELFPVGPAKQGCKVAGLPQPLGKGGY